MYLASCVSKFKTEKAADAAVTESKPISWNMLVICLRYCARSSAESSSRYISETGRDKPPWPKVAMLIVGFPGSISTVKPKKAGISKE